MATLAQTLFPARTAPAQSPAASRVTAFLARAGVRINPSNPAPWDLVVHDDRFYEAVARDGSIGFGESYMAGWWDCASLDALFTRLCLVPKAKTRGWEKFMLKVASRLLNLQSKARAHQVIDAHYELSNEMFAKMLDPHMQYSCAYWDGVDTLDAAQERKLALIAEKLRLQPGMQVLEIGCGWGGLAAHLAKHHGVQVTAVNICQAQLQVARERCAGLPVTFVDADYRDITGQYDRVVSVGMFEAVGAKNFDAFMGVVHRCLRDDGVFLLHTIGENLDRVTADPWIVKYIFPNGYIPSLDKLTKAMEGRFVVEDLHNIGPHYDRTLLAWVARFEAAWPEIAAMGFDERFRRMWTYYLHNCAGAFRGRSLQLWQIVSTRYRSGTHYARVAAS